MKLFLIFIISLIMSLYSLSAQTTISGVVHDSLNKPIPFASIYLSNTSIGVYSDNDGYYSLSIPNDGAYEMIISCIGYKLKMININANGVKQFYSVNLQSNIYSLDEIVVKSRHQGRAKNYAIFKRTFLGESSNSLECKIINPEELILHRDEENKILTGYSKKSLVIENKTLGYIIKYDLLDYSYDLKNGFTRYSGYSYFEPLKTRAGQLEVISRKRLVAYYGSQMHFLRSLFSDSLEKEGYRIYKASFDIIKKKFILTRQIDAKDLIRFKSDNFGKVFTEDTILIRYTHNHPELENENDQPVRFSPNVIVSYSDVSRNATDQLKNREFNSIITLTDTLSLYSNGSYYKPYFLTWAGNIAEKRLGSTLPSDYVPFERNYKEPEKKILVFDTLKTDFERTVATMHAEKVYLHTDRNLYFLGDNLWFKAYVIDPYTNLPSKKTQNLHVELISPDSKIILKRVVKITEGSGNGDFILPDSLMFSKYWLRAYTNHMRNYGDSVFFFKSLFIQNHDTIKHDDKVTHAVRSELSIYFFPEGGSLVDNVTSRVAFKAIDSYGNGRDINLNIFSATGQLITKVRSVQLGMGIFNFKPLKGYTYYAIATGDDGSSVRTELPQSFPVGIAIRTSSTYSGDLILSVSTNTETLASLERDLTLVLSSRKLVNRISKIRIDSISENIIIPQIELPGGIIRLTLLTGSGLPLCERLLFLDNTNNTDISIDSLKAEYKPHEAVKFSMTLEGDSTLTKSGYFSLSVAEKSFTEISDSFPGNISSWFLLESDVRGTIENPSWYFDNSNSRRFQDLDILLLTQGWRDFAWKYDSLNSYKNESGFSVSGKVRRIAINKPLENTDVNLGVFTNDLPQFYLTRTDINGSFKFENIDLTGSADAFISSTGKFENAAGKIFIDSMIFAAPPTNLPFSGKPREFNTSEDSKFQQESLFALDNNYKYTLNDTLKIGEVFINAKRIETPQEIRVKESRQVYGNPDKELPVTVAQENYSEDVFSYISGRIPGVRVVRSTHLNIPKVIVRSQSHEGEQGAIILLNGKYIDQTDLTPIMNLQMQMVDRIDILNSSPLYGMSGANGVVNIITRVATGKPLPSKTENSLLFKIHGYDQPRIFYSPKHEDIKPYESDNRRTIYWNSNVNIIINQPTSIEFLNNDMHSEKVITIEGITNDGIPISRKFNYLSGK